MDEIRSRLPRDLSKKQEMNIDALPKDLEELKRQILLGQKGDMNSIRYLWRVWHSIHPEVPITKPVGDVCSNLFEIIQQLEEKKPEASPPSQFEIDGFEVGEQLQPLKEVIEKCIDEYSEDEWDPSSLVNSLVEALQKAGYRRKRPGDVGYEESIVQADPPTPIFRLNLTPIQAFKVTSLDKSVELGTFLVESEWNGLTKLKCPEGSLVVSFHARPVVGFLGRIYDEPIEATAITISPDLFVTFQENVKKVQEKS